MKRVAIAIVAMGLFLAWEGTASAQAQQGDQEVLLFGSINTNIVKGPDFGQGSTRNTSSTGNFFFNLGQFLSDRFEIGGGPSVSITTAGGDTSADVGVNGFLRYYLGANEGKVKPYVGAEYSVFSLNPPEGASISDLQFINANFGVKNYFSEHAAVDFLGAYGFNPGHVSEVQQFTFRVGLSVVF